MEKLSQKFNDLKFKLVFKASIPHIFIYTKYNRCNFEFFFFLHLSFKRAQSLPGAMYYFISICSHDTRSLTILITSMFAITDRCRMAKFSLASCCKFTLRFWQNDLNSMFFNVLFLKWAVYIPDQFLGYFCY